jgi:hypothetical protein
MTAAVLLSLTCLAFTAGCLYEFLRPGGTLSQRYRADEAESDLASARAVVRAQRRAYIRRALQTDDARAETDWLQNLYDQPTRRDT